MLTSNGRGLAAVVVSLAEVCLGSAIADQPTTTSPDAVPTLATPASGHELTAPKSAEIDQKKIQSATEMLDSTLKAKKLEPTNAQGLFAELCAQQTLARWWKNGTEVLPENAAMGPAYSKVVTDRIATLFPEMPPLASAPISLEALNRVRKHFSGKEFPGTAAMVAEADAAFGAILNAPPPTKKSANGEPPPVIEAGRSMMEISRDGSVEVARQLGLYAGELSAKLKTDPTDTIAQQDRIVVMHAVAYVVNDVLMVPTPKPVFDEVQKQAKQHGQIAKPEDAGKQDQKGGGAA